MSGFSELFRAAIDMDDPSEVTRLVLEDGVDVNCTDSMRRTVLHWTAGYGFRLGMIELLVGLRADINARDLHQMTPLHIAVKSPADDKVEMIMKGRLPSLTGENDPVKLQRIFDQKKACRSIIEKQKIQLIDCLLKFGADINAKYNTNITSLSEAIRMESLRAVNILANLGLASCKDMTCVGLTAFFVALDLREKEVLEHLVRNGADVNDPYNTGLAVHLAVQTGNVQIVQALLDHGADANDLNSTNVTPVNHCTLRGNNDPECYTFLAKLGVDFNLPYTQSSAIREAIISEKPDLVRCLVLHGADVNVQYMTEYPILTASLGKDLHMLEHLVRCGANINARYDTAFYAIGEAITRGNAEIAKVLLSHGARLDRSILKGITALYAVVFHVVAYLKHSERFEMIEVIKLLIRLGADVNMKSDVVDIFDESVMKGDISMVKLLCSAGADMNCLRKREATLLSHLLSGLTETRITHTIKTLVESGADLLSKHDTSTPLFLAIERSDTNMVKALASLGARMDGAMRRGTQPLHLACLRDDTETVAYLIEKGADPNAEFISGIEPLLFALHHHDAEMVQCLLQYGANPVVGDCYTSLTALSELITKNSDIEIARCLIEGGATPCAIVLGAVPPLDEKAATIAKSYGVEIPGLWLSETVLYTCVIQGGKTELVEMLLSLVRNKASDAMANRSSFVLSRAEGSSAAGSLKVFGINGNIPEQIFHSILDGACYGGDLDIMRLLIIDGSDVNKSVPRSTPRFECLPLASYVDYHTLKETCTAEKVVERIEQDCVPRTSCHRMKCLLSTPGLGDAQCIEYSTEIHDEVYEAICRVCEKLKNFQKLHVRSCGSSAEGTKVGLPDEMDFLVEVAKVECGEQSHLTASGHDYVTYSRENGHYFLKDGSKAFHSDFAKELSMCLRDLKKLSKHLVQFCEDFSIKNSNRRATSPFRIVWFNDDRTVNVHISVDVVPCFHVAHWPEGALSKTWLLDGDDLKRHGYYLVPKPPHARSDLAKEYTEEELRTLWKISFAHLETYHMQRLEKRVKDVYVLAKCLRNPDVCRIMVTDEGSYPRNMDKYITSYMLKMIFFKNVEDFLRSDLSLGEMVCRVYDELEDGLSQGFIPLYFMPKVNALGGHKLNIPKCVKVARIMKRFVHALSLRDCRQDQDPMSDMEVIVYQRKPRSVYRSIEIGQSDEDPSPGHSG